LWVITRQAPIFYHLKCYRRQFVLSNENATLVA
jgi:hypothetical protein